VCSSDLSSISLFFIFDSNILITMGKEADYVDYYPLFIRCYHVKSEFHLQLIAFFQFNGDKITLLFKIDRFRI
jgi:hypothetical protein